jgi:hypothetical protein
MAVSRQTMTDEQRKSVAVEYLKAFDNGGVTSTGGEMPRRFRTVDLLESMSGMGGIKCRNVAGSLRRSTERKR